jgi:DNA primase
MNNLTQQIKEIDLPALMQSEGVELTNKGNKFVALCPFPLHGENNPSFYVFSNNHFKCFGCGEYGDAVDFLRLLYGYDFGEALRHLAIDGKLTGQQRHEIEKKKKIEAKRLQRERDLVFTLGILIRATRKCTDGMTLEQFEEYGEIMNSLPTWEYCHNILSTGSKEEKQEVLEGLKNMQFISRKYLFKPDFNYRGWLREFSNGVPNEFEVNLHFG